MQTWRTLAWPRLFKRWIMLSFGQIYIQQMAECVLLFLSALIRWTALSFLWITEPCSFTLLPCNHVSWWKPWHRHLKKQTLRYLCSYHRWWRILLTCYFKKVRFWDHCLKDPKIILLLQDARFSVRGKIWDKLGEVCQGPGTHQC